MASGRGEADVVPDGPVEEERFLGHHTELAAQRLEPHRAEVHPVDAHRSLVGVVEAHSQLGDRGLAGSGGADDGETRAGRDVQIHAGQYLLAGRVGERHRLEGDPPLDGAERGGVGRLGHVGLLLQEVAELGGGRLTLLVGVVQHHQLRDGGEEGGEVEREGGQHTHCETTVDHQPSPHAQYHRLADDADALRCRAVVRGHPGGVQVGVLVVGDHTVVLGDIAALAVVGGDRADAGQVLRQVGQDGGDPVAHSVVTPLRGAPEPQRQHHGDRDHHADGQGGQQGVQVEEDAGDHRQGQPLHHDHYQTLLQQHGEGLDVAGHARHQHPGALGCVEVQREPLEMSEHPQPQLVHEAFAEPAPQGGPGAPDNHMDQHRGEEDPHDDAHQSEAALQHAVVDADLGEQGTGLGGQCLHDDQGHDQQHPPTVRAEHRAQAQRWRRPRTVRELDVLGGMVGFGVEDVGGPVDHLVGDAGEGQAGGRVGLRRRGRLRADEGTSHEDHQCRPPSTDAASESASTCT